VVPLALKKPPFQSGLHPPHIQKEIFAYTKTPPTSTGLVQLQDKIVVRFALTIYPYSFGGTFKDALAKYRPGQKEWSTLQVSGNACLRAIC
jgi:hypothetical protein